MYQSRQSSESSTHEQHRLFSSQWIFQTGNGYNQPSAVTRIRSLWSYSLLEILKTGNCWSTNYIRKLRNFHLPRGRSFVSIKAEHFRRCFSCFPAVAILMWYGGDCASVTVYRGEQDYISHNAALRSHRVSPLYLTRVRLAAGTCSSTAANSLACRMFYPWS